MNLKFIFAFVFVALCLSVAYLGNEFFVTSEHFFVCFSAGIVLLWFCVHLFYGKKEIHISVLDVAVFALVAYLAVSCLVVSKFPVGYLPFGVLCCCWLTYTVAKQQMDFSLFIPMVILLILLSGVVQSIWGLFQNFNIIPVYVGRLKTVGSFQNPGVYANYLACIFPLALAILLYSEKQTKKALFVISLLFILCCIFVMPFTMARSAWLGMLAGTFVILEYRYGLFMKLTTRMKRSTLIFVMVMLLMTISIIGVTLFHFKPESAQGRILIYKIAMGMCKEHPLFGTGFNTFAKEYNLYQADYFASGAGSEMEKWLAGNNQVAFNEYLQITVETGLVGFVLILVIGATLIFYRKQVCTPYAIGAIGGLTSLACCACFSYPFHEIPIIVLAGWMLLVVGNDIKSFSIPIATKVQKSIVVFYTLMTVFLCYYSITTLPSVSRWKKLVTYKSIHGFDDSREQYARLYSQLDNNPYFLYNYGIELVLAREYERSIPILKQACHYFSDTNIFCYLGDAYKWLGQYEKAETNYWLASNMTPNRFLPLYNLAKLYRETGDNVKASELATILIKKKEKVPSHTTNKIKTEMKQMLDSLSFK
jgi:O-antigen ligase